MPSIRIKGKIKNTTTKKINQITEIKNNYQSESAKRMNLKIDKNHNKNQEKILESRKNFLKN